MIKGGVSNYMMENLWFQSQADQYSKEYKPQKNLKEVTIQKKKKKSISPIIAISI